jgi:hypothetical protein
MTMKRTRRRSATLALGAFAVALSACDDGTAIDGLDDQMTIDAAMLAADATLEEVTLFRGAFGFGGFHIPGVDETPHDRHPAPPGGHHGLDGEFSGTRAVSFFDESGTEQDAYDALTTASIRILHDVEGSVVRDRFSAEIRRERDMTASGLVGEETHRSWKGSGSSYMARNGVLEDGSERSHTAQGSFVFEDVVVPIPGSEPRWPVSGTITRDMHMTRTGPDGTETRDVSIVITFDGTSIATAVVNGETMEIDLAAREHRNPLHRRRGG